MMSAEEERMEFFFRLFAVNRCTFVPRNRLHDAQPKNVRPFTVSKFRMKYIIRSESCVHVNSNFNNALWNFHCDPNTNTPVIASAVAVAVDTHRHEPNVVWPKAMAYSSRNIIFLFHNYYTIWLAALRACDNGQMCQQTIRIVVRGLCTVNHRGRHVRLITFRVVFSLAYQVASSKICTLDIIYVTHSYSYATQSLYNL